MQYRLEIYDEAPGLSGEPDRYVASVTAECSKADAAKLVDGVRAAFGKNCRVSVYEEVKEVRCTAVFGGISFNAYHGSTASRMP